MTLVRASSVLVALAWTGGLVLIVLARSLEPAPWSVLGAAGLGGAVVAGVLARGLGRSAAGWAIASLVAPVFALPVLAFLPDAADGRLELQREFYDRFTERVFELTSAGIPARQTGAMAVNQVSEDMMLEFALARRDMARIVELGLERYGRQ